MAKRATTTHTLQSVPFEPGTEVTAYRTPTGPEAGEPVGQADATATVEVHEFRNQVTFAGLREGATYSAAAEVDGEWRRVNFRAKPDR